MSIIRNRIQQSLEWWEKIDPVVRWRLVLGLAGLGLACGLIFGSKPWQFDIDPTIRPRYRDTATIYSWWAAFINLVVVGGLAALCPWWAGRKVEGISEGGESSGSRPRYFFPLVVIAMLVAAVFGAQRLDHSLWDDEEYSLRRSVLGYLEPSSDSDELEMRGVNWTAAMFYYRKPNNHVLHSLAARSAIFGLQFIPDPRGQFFSEWKFRLPAYLAGVAAVGALAWFLAAYGFPLAGVIAAFFLAVHPWALRYLGEARGYSLIFLLLPLLLIAWRSAMLTGRWRAWAGVAVTSAALVYTYPGMLYTLVVLNLATVGFFLLQRKTALPAVNNAGRWFVVNSLAAMAMIQLMLPLVPQVAFYMTRETSMEGQFSWIWMQNFGAYLLAGAAWSKSFLSEPVYPELLPIALAGPTAFFLAVSVSAVLVVMGLMLFARRGGMAFAAVVVLVLPSVLAYLHALSRSMYLYEWYLVYLLPGLVAVAAVALGGMVRWMSGSRAGRIGAAVMLVVIFGGYLMFTHPIRTAYIEGPLQAIRESVRATRPFSDLSDPGHDGVVTASFCVVPYVYDPRCVTLKGVDDLHDLARLCATDGRILYLNVGHPWSAQRLHPELWEILNDEEIFEPIARFRGFDPSLDRIVVRLIPDGMAALQRRLNSRD